ncbi:MAG TPA: cupin domain-containing protein [Acetobacteraceae bacterium]|nr:cupin domain-containing protein [Acetobacteraceae bacterium]
MSQSEALPRLETPEVRVTEHRMVPGAATGHHRHGYDYVIVPLTAGVLGIVSAEGETRTEIAPGVAYFRKAGVEHDVFNAGDAPLAFVEVELKDRPG